MQILMPYANSQIALQCMLLSILLEAFLLGIHDTVNRARFFPYAFLFLLHACKCWHACISVHFVGV